MKKIILGILILTSVSVAQNGGTIESRYGIGELDQMLTARQRGMGGAATALQSNADISAINPASWSAINELRLAGGLAYEYLSLSKADASITSGAIKGFSFVFPLEESLRLRLGSSIQPVSRANYKTIGYGTLDGESYSVLYEGSGGLSMFRAGLSAEPIAHVKIGAAYQYYFGTIDQLSELRFDNGSWFNARQTRATAHSGSGFHLGVLYDGIRDVHIGVSLRPPTSINASRNLVIEYSTVDSTINGASGTQDIPLAFSAGIAWQLTDALLVAADYSRQDWTEAEMFEGKQNGQGAAYKFALGAEWYPYKNDPDARTLSRTAFRLGWYLQQPYMTFDNENAQETFITAGAGFPIFGANRGDIAIEYGWRGNDAHVLGTQRILRLSLSVTVGEPWFIRNTD